MPRPARTCKRVVDVPAPDVAATFGKPLNAFADLQACKEAAL